MSTLDHLVADSTSLCTPTFLTSARTAIEAGPRQTAIPGCEREARFARRSRGQGASARSAQEKGVGRKEKGGESERRLG